MYAHMVRKEDEQRRGAGARTPAPGIRCSIGEKMAGFMDKMKKGAAKLEKFDKKIDKRLESTFGDDSFGDFDVGGDPKTRKHKNCRTCKCH